MSEKRFELRGLGVFDTENNNKSLSRVDVVELLNNLTEENEQLNLAIDDLASHTSCDELKKEIEQLRRYVYHCPQICNKILAYLRKSETEDVKAVSDAMGDDKYFDEEIDTLRSWE